MALSEDEIIGRYFDQPGLAAQPGTAPGIVLGIGDDCALLELPADTQLAISTDVLVENVHFPANAPAELLGFRALAVNLSDLAAMGAQPLCFTLALTLPGADETWLEAFSRGLAECAGRYHCPLVGGNLTRGPLQIAVHVQGLVPAGVKLFRNRARPDHDVYVSGGPGRAGLALEYLKGRCKGVSEAQARELIAAYYKPEPRLALGCALRRSAAAMQDVSDGLLLDLGRMAAASKVGISIEVAALPLEGILTALRPSEDVFRLVLTAGDDYELIFTAPPGKRKAIQAAGRKTGVRVTRIGRVTKGEGVEVLDLSGRPLEFGRAGYEHFDK